MDLPTALKLQYHAALKALRLEIEACPDDRWNDPADGCAAFWRVVYHTLFFTQFYLQPDHESFTPWERHQDEAQFLGMLGRDGGRMPHPCEPYTRDQLLEYWQLCDDAIDPGVDVLDLHADESGFPWYPISKLEHQLVNLRHIQHHVGTLTSRLRREANVEVAWVGRA